MPVIIKAMPLFKRVPNISKNRVITTMKIIATPVFILFSLNSFEPFIIKRSPADISAVFAKMATVFIAAISVERTIGKNIKTEYDRNILMILLWRILGNDFNGVKKIKAKAEIPIRDEDMIPGSVSAGTLYDFQFQKKVAIYTIKNQPANAGVFRAFNDSQERIHIVERDIAVRNLKPGP